MSDGVSVVIASLDEEAWIADAVRSAIGAGASEVIVADGGSADATIAKARAAGACVIEGERMRARQFNRGAKAAAHGHLIFLHADTRLPARAARSVGEALARFDFGGFRIRFAEDAFRLRVAATMINARTSLTRCPWGDQAQFIRRDRFLSDGGFREIPIMEDYELAVRMKRGGRSVLLPDHVTTSGRRFLERGVLRTAMLNWRIVIRWRLGTDAETLASMYKR